MYVHLLDQKFALYRAKVYVQYRQTMHNCIFSSVELPACEFERILQVVIEVLLGLHQALLEYLVVGVFVSKL